MSDAASSAPEFKAGDIAWTLTATALVWLMIPGLGYFYSGMARSKNALSLIMLSAISIAVVSFQVKRIYCYFGSALRRNGPPCKDEVFLYILELLLTLPPSLVVAMGLFTYFQPRSQSFHWKLG